MTENPSNTKICPTCGTRLNAGAARCSVCGAALAPATAAKPVQVSRMPEITLSLPVVLGLMILLLAVGAGTVYAVFQNNQPALIAIPTITPTTTITPTASPTATITPTGTPQPTPTLEPPLTYKVQSNDSCLSIAAFYDVSFQSIVTLNNLPIECNTLTIGQELLIPRPTPTASPQPTSTLNPTQEAQANCETAEIIVKDTDTLSGIAANYSVTIESIREYNGLTSDIIRANQKLIIPLCARGPQATPSATPIPPYPQANLLLPADGAGFTAAGDVITLQWAAVGELRPNEAYAVTIEDVTAGTRRVEYVTDTKFTLPEDSKPTDTVPHTFRWSILAVRQVGSDQESGQPVWEPAGAVSGQRVFSWMISK
jgi:LysM repeat protein